MKRRAQSALKTGNIRSMFERVEKRKSQNELGEHALAPQPQKNSELDRLSLLVQHRNQKVINVPPDGDCLFSSLACLLQSENVSLKTANDIRQELVEYILQHPQMVLGSKFMNEQELQLYLEKMRQPKEWGDGIMVSAAVLLYNTPITVLTVDGEMQVDINQQHTVNADCNRKTLQLGLINNNHYVAIVMADMDGKAKDEDDVDDVLAHGSEPSEVQLTAPPSCRENTRHGEWEYDFKQLSSPNQPDVSIIPPQQVNSRKFFFQNHWYKTFPWLHYEQSLKAMLCFSCARASAFGLLDSVKYTESSFLSSGYTNWKKAVGKNGRFDGHQSSNCHSVAIQALHDLLQSTPVSNLLSQQLSADQDLAQKCLKLIFTTVRFLARQGLALRGHTESESNFMQLLQVRISDLPQLASWFDRRSDYTHHSIQNEILQLYGKAILRDIVARVRMSQMYAVIVDGTQDVNGIEQESICIRFVSEDLNPSEEFVGFYAVQDTTGSALAGCVKDALLRFGLPVENLRGQTYDGASNMCGIYNGCQAIIAQLQPLAAYVHCAAHCCNLVASAACASSEIVSSSIQTIHDFGVLCSASGKFKSLFKNVASSAEDGPVRNIKPLCPTRWLVRLPAIQATLQQYRTIIDTLQEACSGDSSSEIKVRASGLLRKFQDGSTLMCLVMAKRIVAPLECLNKALQAKSATVAGMLEATEQVKQQLIALRTDEQLHTIMTEVEETISKLELDPLKLPRRKQPPKRFSGSAAAYHSTSVSQYFCVEFYKVIDVCIQQLSSRLLDSPGLQRYKDLESVLITGRISSVVQQYPELASSTFQAQLDLFHQIPTLQTDSSATLCTCVEALQAMAPATRAMFPTVEALVRLLLVNPASSASAERSFSSLRRLKTYMRSTCGQLRLNNIALCHVHKDVLDQLDVDKLMTEFVLKHDSRGIIFGKI